LEATLPATHITQNHGPVQAGRDCQGSASCSKQGQLWDHFAQVYVQLGLENLKGWRWHRLPGLT